jgi:hypothetical protein
MGNCLYSSYEVPKGNFNLNQEEISYLGGKMRGPVNIYWQCQKLSLKQIHVEADQKFVIVTSDMQCDRATIKAQNIYVPENANLKGCTLIGSVHKMPMNDINATFDWDN